MKKEIKKILLNNLVNPTDKLLAELVATHFCKCGDKRTIQVTHCACCGRVADVGNEKLIKDRDQLKRHLRL